MICASDAAPFTAVTVSAIPVIASGAWTVAVTWYRSGTFPVTFRTTNPPYRLQPSVLVSVGFPEDQVTSASPMATGCTLSGLAGSAGPNAGTSVVQPEEKLKFWYPALVPLLTAPQTIRTVSVPVTPPGNVPVQLVALVPLPPKELLTTEAAGYAATNPAEAAVDATVTVYGDSLPVAVLVNVARV